MTGSVDLSGKGVVVTGSSRGIGRAVARALAAAGAGVVVNGRNADAVDEVSASIEAEGGSAIGCVGSAAEFDFAGELVARCVEHFGRIDGLVNCAGIAEPEAASILEISPEAWREVLDAHLTSTFHCCRHAAPRMVAAGTGSIVNTSSHAFSGIYGGTAYPAAKGATNALTLALAAELREAGVRVNAVCPGARTRLSTGSAYERKIHSLHARGILSDMVRDASLAPAEPEHVAPLYGFLVSEDARSISGRIFSAAGGYVGLFEESRETLLAFRDAATQGVWPLAELAERLRDAAALANHRER